MEGFKMKIKNLTLAAAASLLFFLVSPASSSEQQIYELKNKIQALENRIQQLESQLGKSSGQGKAFFSDRDNYFEEIERMQERMRRMFDSPYDTGSGIKTDMFNEQDINLTETKDSYEIRFDISNLEKDKVKVDINKYSVTINGEYSKKVEEKNNNRFFSSQSVGSFMKTIPLPVDANIEKIETKQEENTLFIKIPKVV